MHHHKIIKRDDGTKITITVSFSISLYDHIGDISPYSVRLEVLPPKKRKSINISNSDNYEWRRLGWKDRILYDHQTNLQYVSEAEILESKLELWNKLKPE